MRRRSTRALALRHARPAPRARARSACGCGGAQRSSASASASRRSRQRSTAAETRFFGSGRRAPTARAAPGSARDRRRASACRCIAFAVRRASCLVIAARLCDRVDESLGQAELGQPRSGSSCDQRLAQAPAGRASRSCGAFSTGPGHRRRTDRRPIGRLRGHRRRAGLPEQRDPRSSCPGRRGVSSDRRMAAPGVAKGVCYHNRSGAHLPLRVRR